LPNLLAPAAALALCLAVLPAAPAIAQEAEDASGGGQDAETKALDSTATQWSFQIAYQMMPDYYADTLDNGQARPAGLDNYVQMAVKSSYRLNVTYSIPVG
jgi:hypothetical protein